MGCRPACCRDPKSFDRQVRGWLLVVAFFFFLEVGYGGVFLCRALGKNWQKRQDGWFMWFIGRRGGAIKERLPYTEDYLETASPAVEEIIQDARGGQKSG